MKIKEKKTLNNMEKNEKTWKNMKKHEMTIE